MDKLKTFLIYVLIIAGFFVVSEFLSGQLIKQMYHPLSGDIQEEFEYKGRRTALTVDVLDARATRVNGYITAKVTNNTDNVIDKAYIKFDMFAKQDLKAVSRYMEITDLKPSQSKTYTLKFRAGYVDNYSVAIKEDFPDEKYIFELFGYEFNTKNILGMDVSNFIDAQAIKDAGYNGITSIFQFIGKLGHTFAVAAQSVPWWGYVGALAIIAGII